MIYQQSTGIFWLDGKIAARGYSGKGIGKNNHAMQSVVSVGPIPIGLWLLDKDGGDKVTPGYESPTRYSIKLEPEEGTETFGRSAFFIHGDNSSSTASRGCPIVNRPFRRRVIDNSVITHLLVIQ